MGLKDMVAALEWTKNEISNFGGNADLITAFGLSAGAASAHYLCGMLRIRRIYITTNIIIFSLSVTIIVHRCALFFCELI